MRKFNYNFDTIPDRAGTCTIKYDARCEVFGNPDVIPMWIADMDFEVAPPITQAILRRAAHPVYGYDFGGERRGEPLQRWFARRTGWAIEPEWLRFTPGVVTGLGFAIRTFSKKRGRIVIQPPIYPPFRALTEANGRKVISNPLAAAGDGFEMDFDDLDRKLSGAQALILCNPHNPVGRVWSESDLRQVGELCVRHGVTIISDEIHADLVFAPHKHIHIADLDPRFAEQCITFLAPSKSFNIAGLATSAAVMGSAKMREAWDAEYAGTHVITGTVFGLAAMKAAYDECEGWLEELLAYLRGNVDYVRSFIAANIPAVKTIRQEGTYLMWLDFSGLGFGSHKELMDWLAAEAGLGLNSGADFGRGGIMHARMNVATNRATVERAMSQLKAAYDKIKE